ncbi:glycosyltransferase [Gluconacetobacter sacchari DSM 12717]|uniref:Glycosyltransferase n=1 Tax=Gluconacetobacter sacchari DSM 12717 TaxID=1307940 RepID=A0ABQ0PCG2_9PROT|nr:glycosyltransferase [Gluconacetobacter sacchari DSM 12717]
MDGYNLALPRGTGIATYARTLTHCLKAMGGTVDVVYGMDISPRMSADLREIMFFDILGASAGAGGPKTSTARWVREYVAETVTGRRKAVEVPISGRVEVRDFAQRLPAFDRLLNVRRLFRAAGRHFRSTGRFVTVSVPNPPAIMHWTYPLPIRVKGAKNIYTIHDLVPLRLPQTTLGNKKDHFKLISALAESADAICTVSEASREEILSFFPDVNKRLHNTYQSFEPSTAIDAAREAGITQEIRELFGLRPGGFFLFFGSLEPKKNIGRLIEAFLMARTDRPLVIVGAMSWKTEDELRFLERGIAAGRIQKLDYLPAPLLAALIRAARAVLFPSLSEGFGLPVLEALAWGTPVLTSREGALPEVAGQAALFVDAYDGAAISAGIEELDGNDALCAGLSEQGPRQAARFDMKKYEERLGEMYRSVLSSGH